MHWIEESERSRMAGVTDAAADQDAIATVANQGQRSLDTASTWLLGHRTHRELWLCFFKKCFLRGVYKSQKWRIAESAGAPAKC